MSEQTKDRFTVTSMTGEMEMRIAIEVLCENLYPAQQGWGDEMATAIDCLKHHQANIVKGVNAHAANQRTIAELREALTKIKNDPYTTCACAEIASAALASTEGKAGV